MQGLLGGGRPPSLTALQGSGEEYDLAQAETFAETLFFRYYAIEGAKEKPLQQLLTASLLKDLPKFLQLLKEHPEGKQGTSDDECFEQHQFLERVKDSAIKAEIQNPIATLLRWSQLIEADFHRRNFVFVPMKDLRRTIP